MKQLLVEISAVIDDPNDDTKPLHRVIDRNNVIDETGDQIENIDLLSIADNAAKHYLIEVGIGISSGWILVLSSYSDSGAIDALADSEDLSHLIDDDEPCECEPNECDCTTAGNYGHRVNLDNVAMRECGIMIKAWTE